LRAGMRMTRGSRGRDSNARVSANSELKTSTVPNGNGPAKTYRHKGEKRRNIPPAAIAAEGRVPTAPKLHYSYSPRLDPVLRFDSTGAPDKLPPLLEKAKRELLTDAEARLLAEALRREEPWLEWAGKRETNGFAVDPVALHIHERVSTQAILKVAARKDVTRDLFADPQLDYHQAVQFYRHEMDWSNRLILGDSLQVMASLAQREDLAGKVQMIYVDPPYGIKFASNFQSELGNRNVKDKESDLTHEPEMVRAYRDAWTLGVHSYLTYLRDRLLVAEKLLADTGSIFVQISDENMHRVRMVMDEAFGRSNFIALISFQTTSGFAEAGGLSRMGDYSLWYGKDHEQTKARTLFEKQNIEPGSLAAGWLISPDGDYRGVTSDEEAGRVAVPEGARFYKPDNLQSQGSASAGQSFEHEGKVYQPGNNNHWKPNYPAGMQRLAHAERIHIASNSIQYRRYADDFPLKARGNIWTDTLTGSFTEAKMYVVQTNPKVIERCVLLTTKPGDLVLDPTCGSGTTAFVAENNGRRWITIDTSRVTIAIARQRLLTAKFDYYELKEEAKGVAGGFKCKTAPHITLKSIAQNTNLDPIFAKHDPILDKALAVCNAALAKVPPDLKSRLATKLLTKQKAEGKRAVTDADRRRWLLPPDNRDKDAKLTVDARFGGWYRWEVPFDTDPDWPKPLQDAVSAYCAAWRAKMDEVNACIEANAEPEELVDQLEIRGGVVRVSGPFTVEAVQPQELSLDEADSPIGGAPEPDTETFDGGAEPQRQEIAKGPTPAYVGNAEPIDLAMPAGVVQNREAESRNAESYIENMIRLLWLDGVRFPDNKEMKFSRLDPTGTGSATIQAEGRWVARGETDSDPEGERACA
jgi:adenine-specific DNA-methyltransferase